MFEDSLVESTGRIRSRSKWFAIGSFLLQAVLLAALTLIPFLHPAALPKQALTMMLTAPPPPPAPAELPAHAAVTHVANLVTLPVFTAPNRIPRHAAMVEDRPPGPVDLAVGNRVSGPGLPDALWKTVAPAVPEPKPTPKPGPLRISAGVAAGQLIAPIQPVYPPIAREARIQGTVVVEATISKEGMVEHARAVSGHPLLATAALDAIEKARYQPYRLNGEPVEVQTTISVIFRLDQ
ncbi:MAG TPA: energy transducer TonB [Silvibacterium sp.]|jgi:protein TonB|nr:energy transducer TonB [Silvibacterium sp.]